MGSIHQSQAGIELQRCDPILCHPVPHHDRKWHILLVSPGLYSEPERMDDHTFNEDVFTAKIGPAVPASFQTDNSTNLFAIEASQEPSPVDPQQSYYAPKAFYHMNNKKKKI